MKFHRFIPSVLLSLSVLLLAVSFSLADTVPEEIPVPQASKPILFREENGSEKEQFLEDLDILENFDPAVIGLEGTISASYPGTYTFHPVILPGRESSFVFKDTPYPTGYDPSGNPVIDCTFELRFRIPFLTENSFETNGEEIDVIDKIDDYSSYQNYSTYFIVTGNKASTKGKHTLTISVNPDYAHADTAVFENGSKTVTLEYEIIRKNSGDIPKTGDASSIGFYFCAFVTACIVFVILCGKRKKEK